MTSLAEWIAVGVILGVLTLTLLTALLTLAWRLVGTRIEFRQVTLIFAYIYSGSWIGFCAGALLAATGVQLVAPQVFTDYLAIVRTGAPLAQRMAEARTLLENALHGPAAALFVFACLVWGSAVVWTIVAWGAFRNSFGCGRVKATLATVLWAAMLLILMQLAAWAARNL